METRYIGDGVYAKYDGYHIVLAVNDHRNNVVYLDEFVMKALIEYYNDTIKQCEQEKNV